jgi:23S rRNA (guanosine2251-2'-O)-methyltransferase
MRPGGRPGPSGPGPDRRFGPRPPRPAGPWRDRPAAPFAPARPLVRESDLLRDDEELIAGRRPVEEAFVARRAAHRLLVVPQRRQALERLVLHATSLRIPVVEVEGGSLTALAGFDGHQGIALAVEPRTYAEMADVLARAVERGEPPFVLVLDSLEDPQNVGTLLRSAEAAGVHGVIYPTHRQAPLTPAAIKASAGAVEHLLLCPVDDLPGALSDLRIRGLRIAAAEADAPLTADEADLRGPLAIVVGSEGQGLSPAVRRRADVAIRIPMRGSISSLNAAVAGSILLFAAVAQRERSSGSTSPPAAAPSNDEPVEAAESATAESPTARKAAGAKKRTGAKKGAEAKKGPAKEKVAAKTKAAGGGKEAGAKEAVGAKKPTKASTTARATTTAATTPETTESPSEATAGKRTSKRAPARTAKTRAATALERPVEPDPSDALLPGGPDPMVAAGSAPTEPPPKPPRKRRSAAPSEDPDRA